MTSSDPIIMHHRIGCQTVIIKKKMFAENYAEWNIVKHRHEA